MMTPKQINQQNYSGLTELMMAAVGIRPEDFTAVRILVETEKKQNSDLGLSIVDKLGNSVLHHAASCFEGSSLEVKNRKIDIFKYLVCEGADPLLRNNRGEAPLDIDGFSL